MLRSGGAGWTSALDSRDFLTGGGGRGVRRGHFAWPGRAYRPQQRFAM